MGEEIDLNKLRDEAKKKGPENVAVAGSGAINTRERFQALSATRQLEMALADGHDNVPSYLAENFPVGVKDVDLNKLREQVRKMEEDKK